ncbi:hypothetical protein GOODEAATRI_003695 [Goodea atripinnis]|uniref:Uncharacterized protein n=1 Tax=Goodea atripinnis TaxID=208336 RepID=A0ABV0N7M5_9TELE
MSATMSPVFCQLGSVLIQSMCGPASQRSWLTHNFSQDHFQEYRGGSKMGQFSQNMAMVCIFSSRVEHRVIQHVNAKCKITISIWWGIILQLLGIHVLHMSDLSGRLISLLPPCCISREAEM